MSNGVSSGAGSMSDAKRALMAQRLKGFSTSRQEADQIKPCGAGDKVPISVEQYRIWLHASMHPEMSTYNEPITIQYRGDLDVAVLTESLNYFLCRHEGWRTGFIMENDVVFQVVQPEVKVNLELVDLSDLPEEEREAESMSLATEQALLPIDLTQAPLFRAMVVRVAPDDIRLHIVLHHVVFDGLSIQETFIPELAAIYAALKAGDEPLLPALTLQYKDYSAWRQEQVALPAMERHLEYWQKQLAGDLPVLRLPTDRPRPAVISQRGDIETCKISRELTDALRELSQAQGATLYMTMLAAFEALLFRYSGQEDVIVGGGADGRRRPELRGMMGYILDTFAVRAHPTGKRPFSAFLQEVKQSVLGALGAAEVPFDRVVQAAGIKRDLSHHPIFQTFFSFLARGGNLPAGWEMKPKTVNGGATKFDIYMEVEELETHTAVCCIYSTDLFKAETIRRMFGHWTTLMQAVCDAPDCALGELPLLTAAERELMLVRWNDQAVDVPATTMHGLVFEQAQRTPDDIAVKFEDVTWTYAELDRQVEKLATPLRAAGAGPGKLVALCIDRSEMLIAGLLAILKTGAAYLPLDPGTPHSRIALCLEDAAPAIVITQWSVVSDLPPVGAKVLLIEDLAKAEALPEYGAAKKDAAGPDDTAYIIHTSGSTGRPKAVELSHGSVVNLLLSMQREPGFKASDTLVAVTTVSFDIAVLELFLPLITGGRVVIASRAVALDPYRLSALMEETSCTVMQATPATWRALIAIDWKGQPGMKVLCGGEALTRDLADKLLVRKLDLWNVYGPTETTIWSTVRRVQPTTGTVPIGRPIANTTTYILDNNEQPVPIGVAGELYIGGVGLAKGYRGQPELTAQKFVSLDVVGGARVYRTGDYAVYRADGTIECQGRADNQVKIRGYRIELEEVELHLNAHPQIAAAAARIWEDPVGGNRMSAYFVAKDGIELSTAQIRDFLRDRLPEYMVPSDFTMLETMPLTSNGKMDRKALPQPSDPTAARPASAFSLNEDEQRLAKIWQEVLGVQSIGKEDNFFELGGHSLLLVILFARVNKEFASNLPITTIFDAQTLSALAKVLKEKIRISSLVPVQPAGRKPPLFMAHSYLLYHGLSIALGSDQPFYGLRELEQDGDLSIEDRARRYVADMRRVQPRGPYRVAGWCAAGPLAVEIARQLLLEGDEVAMLLLFDSWLPGYPESLAKIERSRSLLKVVKGKIGDLKTRFSGMTMSQRMEHIGHVIRRRVKQSRDDFYVRHWAQMNSLSQKLNIPLPQFMHNTTLQTFAAMREFRAESLPVKITLIRAQESTQFEGATPTCGWETVAANGIDVLWAPGDHETMFRGANLRITATLVKQALAEIEAANEAKPANKRRQRQDMAQTPQLVGSGAFEK
jgi:amino acid adenylation domain-containing protein